MTASSGLAAGNRSYVYDLDGNRVQKVEAGVTFDTLFDRTDQQVSVIKTSGTSQTFTYNAYGDLTGNGETAAAVTAMTYDLGGKLTAIDAAGTANDATFTFDALGRFRTRVISGSTDTYSYAGASETVLRISNSSGPTVTDSIVSPSGDRLGIRQGTTVNWLLPDLHSNVGASLDSGETTVVNAIRYDAYGMTVSTGTAGGTAVGAANWKYQGRLDVSPSGLATPLYDMSARFYSPGLGAFSQFDSVLGSAQNPLSMNRFLYALANPATMIDPTGHAACRFGPEDCAAIAQSQKKKQTSARTPNNTPSRSAGRSCRFGAEDCGIIKRNRQFRTTISRITQVLAGHDKSTIGRVGDLIDNLKDSVGNGADLAGELFAALSPLLSKWRDDDAVAASQSFDDDAGGGFLGLPVTTAGAGGTFGFGLPGAYWSIDLYVNADSNGHVFLTSANGLRLGTGGDASLGAGLQFTDARRDSDLKDKFDNYGGSASLGIGPAQIPIGVAGDYSTGTGSDGQRVNVVTFGVQAGGQATGPASAEGHVGPTYTYVQRLDPLDFLHSLFTDPFANHNWAPSAGAP